MERIYERFIAAGRWIKAGVHAPRARVSQESGQTMTEYALILALVAVAAVAALKLIGGDINTLLNTIATDLTQST
jgi:pilus assembly protein Flp/PilA